MFDFVAHFVAHFVGSRLDIAVDRRGSPPKAVEGYRSPRRWRVLREPRSPPEL